MEEAETLHQLIEKHKHSSGRTLLDVACGTGGHIAHLKQRYEVEGLDLDQNMVRIAREKHPEIIFHQGDLVDFDLRKKFDVVMCLFGSIGYAKTKPRLEQAIRNMARHLLPGGVLIIEPWITPGDFKPNYLRSIFVDHPELRIARMNVSAVEDKVSILNFHYLVGTPQGIEYFRERHELGLFPLDEYEGSLRAAGLDTVFDPEGLTGRGLYIATSRLSA